MPEEYEDKALEEDDDDNDLFDNIKEASVDDTPDEDQGDAGNEGLEDVKENEGNSV